MAESKSHRKQVRDALKDERLQTALKRAVAAYKVARKSALEGFDLSRAQDEVRAIKERSIADLDALFAKFKAEAEKVGAVVHEVEDGVGAADIILKLAEDRGVKLIAKSKSMLTEEIELNPRLEKAGLEVVETDLGEWIIQLAHEKPSHFTAPAMHKTREQVAELFSKVTSDDVDADIPKLVEVARKQLRQVFFDADMGISGANIAIAETGTLVVVSNEGNARLVTTLPPIHVAVVGYEKIVSSMDDATAILKVLSKSGTGQKQTAYISFITGPSRTSDIEKTLTLGVHGPTELHIIFVDAGRKAMAADDVCKEALYCIKCGACLNTCPAYKSVGGHAYGNAYMGGIGSVVTAFHRNLDATEDTLGLCTGCGYCKSICPSRIDVPGIVLDLRGRLMNAHGMPFPGKVAMGVLRSPALFEKAVRFARARQAPFMDEDNTLKELPLVSGVIGDREFPGLAPRFLRGTLPERSGESGKMAVSFYAGCVIDYIYPEIGEAIWKVLSKSDVTALFPGDQACCGAPAIYVGDWDTARKLAAHNIAALETGSPSYVVTGCPTCAVMLKERFPELLKGTELHERAVGLAGKVMDFSAFARDVLDLKCATQSAGRVTYHDPCHQVRGLGTSDCSRDLIRRAGLELVEMENSDECCGFAGSYAIKQSGVSNAILGRKIASIADTEAKTLVTDCPGCIMQIRGGLRKRKMPIEVCHTAQIIARSME